MNVVVSIGGEREAVPVRAIPFLTDLDAGLQPIVLAKIFAEEDHDPPQSRTSTATKRRRLPGLQAFRLESGVAKPISVRAWSMYSADLHQMEGMALEMSDRERLIKATSLLPPGAFVWKDEFEESYKKTFGEGGTMVWNGPEDDLSMDFSPLIPSKLRELVMEGFEATPAATPEVDHVQPHTQPDAPREPVMRAQERLVLEAIRSLGLDPMALPRRIPGKRWVKTDVKAKVGTGPSNEFDADSAFKATWDRLRAGDEIREI